MSISLLSYEQLIIDESRFFNINYFDTILEIVSKFCPLVGLGSPMLILPMLVVSYNDPAGDNDDK